MVAWSHGSNTIFLYEVTRLRRKEFHGRCYTPEYSIWEGILTRCLNKNDLFYPRYGGKGITVCKEWATSFEAFFADMGLRPGPKYTVDRRDNNLGYSPENCRWATYAEQARNRSNTRFLTYDGQTKCIADWAEVMGMSKSVLWYRIMKLKWSTEKALLHRKRGEEYGISGC